MIRIIQRSGNKISVNLGKKETEQLGWNAGTRVFLTYDFIDESIKIRRIV